MQAAIDDEVSTTSMSDVKAQLQHEVTTGIVTVAVMLAVAAGFFMHRASAARETPYGPYHVDTDSVPPKLHGLGFRRKPATRQAPMEYVRGPRSPARPRPRPASAPSRRRPLPYEDPPDDDSLRVSPEHTSPWVKSLSVKVRLSSPD